MADVGYQKAIEERDEASEKDRYPKGGYKKEYFPKNTRSYYYNVTEAEKRLPKKDRSFQEERPQKKKKTASPNSYKRGGKVRKTGMAKVHKGERVLTKAQQRRMKIGKGGRSHTNKSKGKKRTAYKR
jgi:hypothetical protein